MFLKFLKDDDGASGVSQVLKQEAKGKPDIQRSRFIDSIPDEHKEIKYHSV